MRRLVTGLEKREREWLCATWRRINRPGGLSLLEHLCGEVVRNNETLISIS